MDIRFLLLLGAGVVAAAWALYNANADRRSSRKPGTNGYV